METPEEKEHIAILRDLRHWVLFSADSDVDVPDFDKVAEALKWAISELEEGERHDKQ